MAGLTAKNAALAKEAIAELRKSPLKITDIVTESLKAATRPLIPGSFNTMYAYRPRPKKEVLKYLAFIQSLGIDKRTITAGLVHEKSTRSNYTAHPANILTLLALGNPAILTDHYKMALQANDKIEQQTRAHKQSLSATRNPIFKEALLEASCHEPVFQQLLRDLATAKIREGSSRVAQQSR